MPVKPVPEGYHTVTPYLLVNNLENLIRFTEDAFNATEIYRSEMPDGTIMHVELKIGDSKVMAGVASDEYPPMASMLYLYVEDVDDVYRRALEAGATSLREIQKEFYGDRVGGLMGPEGNHWWVATHVEDISEEEMKRRNREAMEKHDNRK